MNLMRSSCEPEQSSFPCESCASHVKFHVGSASFTGYPVKLHPWQTPQKYDDRFMNAARVMGSPHRGQG